MSDDRSDSQGASPYDEPTETFPAETSSARRSSDAATVSQSASSDDGNTSGIDNQHRGDPRAADAGEGETFAPYRSASRDSDATTAMPATHVADTAGSGASSESDDLAATRAMPAEIAPDSASVAADSEAESAPKTVAIDRDAFHREHNRHVIASNSDQPTAYSARPVDEFAGIDDEFSADPASQTQQLSSYDSGVIASAPAARTDEAAEELSAARAAGRRGTTDVGLLILRVAVGVIAMAHGSQKLFGWWHGPGLSGFEAFLTNNSNPNLGFASDAIKPLAIIGSLSESIGGLMLVLGVLTPIAGSAVLGVMIIATTYKATLAGGIWFFAADGSGNGIEYEGFLAIAAAAIILTGPGRISLDFGRGWARRPFIGSIAWLIVGIAAPVAIWIIFNGVNPLNSPGNPSGG